MSFRLFSRPSRKELIEENNKLRKLVRTDSLTGIGNRNALDEDLKKYAEMFSREDREGHNYTDLVALFFDLDGLKAVNDLHGHNSGDDLIKMTSDIISSNIRATDSTYRLMKKDSQIDGYRLGGDEFVVLLYLNHPHSNPNMAEIFAKQAAHSFVGRVSREFENTTFAKTGKKISVSVGTSTFRESESSIDKMLHVADVRMQNNKDLKPERR